MCEVRNPCKVVAEIGCSHIGSMERAKDLISLAAKSNADYAKFQKRNPTESTPFHIQTQPHPNKNFAYGETYLEHRQALELTIEQHYELKSYCESVGIKYATSVWDITSARQIIGLNPEYIKIPSACNMNYDMLNVLANEYNGDIHISLGMINFEEYSDLFAFLRKIGIFNRVVLYHCTSEYPCPFERLYLYEIQHLKQCFDVKAVGFSNHGYGIAADIAAYILGAEWIERHFIDDRTFRHSDSAASLEPHGLTNLVRDLKNVHKSLGYKITLSNEEKEQKKKLRMS